MRHTQTLLAALMHAPVHAAESRSRAVQQLVHTEVWTKTWPDASLKVATRTITAEVWTAAFQADLDADGKLHIPAGEQPYYLDDPLVMKSGQSLTADATAEIRLKPGTNTCMVRNEHFATLNTKPRTRRCASRRGYPHRRGHLDHLGDFYECYGLGLQLLGPRRVVASQTSPSREVPRLPSRRRST
jgi:hypothetical protein